jgi:AAA domain
LGNNLKLIFLHGLPGVGKLTVARELGKLTGYKVFHNHLAVDLVGSVFDFGSEPFVELRELVWRAVFIESVKENLAGLIFTFAFDRTVRQRFITDVVEILESGRGEVVFVELTCAAEELERRIAEPNRHSFGKLNSVTHFRELKDAGAFAGPRIAETRLVVETTDLSAFEAASLIVKELDSAPSD